MKRIFFTCLTIASLSLAGCISPSSNWNEGPEVLWIEILYTQETINPAENVTYNYLQLETFECWSKMRDGDEVFHTNPNRFANTKVVIVEHHPQFSGSHHDTLYWKFTDFDFEFTWNSSLSNLAANFNGSDEELFVNKTLLSEQNEVTFSDVVVNGSHGNHGKGDWQFKDTFHNITITNHGILKTFNKPKVDCD